MHVLLLCTVRAPVGSVKVPGIFRGCMWQFQRLRARSKPKLVTPGHDRSSVRPESVHTLSQTDRKEKMSDTRWLTVRDVAESLKVHEETVRRWIRRGDLVALDLGGPRAGYRVRPSDLNAFIDANFNRTQKTASAVSTESANE